MKTLKILLSALIMTAFISCNNRTDKNGYDGDRIELGDGNQYNNGIENLDPTDPNNMDSQNGTPGTGMDDTATRSVNSQDMAALYREADMTPQQIQDFENTNKKYRDAEGNIQYNSNTEMDTSLREILSPEQYQKYESWKSNRSQNTNTNNPNTNNTQQIP